MSRYTEDDLTNALIEFYREHSDHDPKIEPEAPYDHYGKKGFADLYIELEKLGLSDTMHERVDTKEAHLIEVKSESAVKSVTGANDIIRQFNRMRQNFYKDDNRSTPAPIVETQVVNLVFELTFIPTPFTITHIFDNIEMYVEAITSNSVDPQVPKDAKALSVSHDGVEFGGVEVSLTLRDPAEPHPPVTIIDQEAEQIIEDRTDPLIQRYIR